MNGNTAQVRQILEQPFDPALIKTRPGSFGQELSYVEGVEYVRRLNEAYDGEWSFEIVTHQVNEHEVIVVGKLTAGGITKAAFGGCALKRHKDTGEIISLADDLKAAATDALKKASSFLGVGLHLYCDNGGFDTRTEKSGASNGNGQSRPSNGSTRPSNGNDQNGTSTRLSSKQLGYLLALGKDQGLDRAAVNEMAVERFGKNLEFLQKSEASSLIGELADDQ